MRLIQFIYLTLIFVGMTIISCKSVNDDCSTESEDNYMKLKATYKKVDENSVKFMLKAERLQQKADEYLPNSENFRVEIYDNENSLIYNSDFEKNYLMVIGDVQPKEVGQTQEYEYTWDKKNNYKKAVPNGKYSAKLIIPAAPEIYSITIDFEM
jgi:hypothetical protein